MFSYNIITTDMYFFIFTSSCVIAVVTMSFDVCREANLKVGGGDSVVIWGQYYFMRAHGSLLGRGKCRGPP